MSESPFYCPACGSKLMESEIEYGVFCPTCDTGRKGEEKKTATRVLTIPQHAVMNGFCYSYCNTLLKKIQKLFAEDKVFQLGAEAALKEEKSSLSSELTKIAYIVIQALCQQIGYYGIEMGCTPKDVNQLMSVVKEFLAIFEQE